ncbi:MAG: hypothetical protein ACE5LV_00430 [Candidatus Aminicenantales bacterium]
MYKRFNIRATPTVMLLDKDGSEVDWHVGYGPPPEKFLERLEKSVQGIDTFKALSARFAQEPENVEVVFKLARKYDRRYDQPKALELYRKVLELDPDGSKGTTEYEGEAVTFTEYAEYAIGAIQVFGAKRDPEPLKAFIKAHPESPLVKSAYQRLSSYYRFSGPKEEARAFFEEYTSRYGDDPYALSDYVARILRDKENLDRGIELAETIKEILKVNPEPYFMKDLAELYMLKEEKDKAEEVFGKRFMEGQVSRMSFNLMDYATFWIRHNMNTASAEGMMELALKLTPDRWYHLQSAARNYIKLGKEEKALAIFGPDFIQKHTDDATVLNNYAWFWAHQGKNLESALEAARKSVALSETAYALDTLSLVYMKLKRYKEALEAAERAVERADEQVKARYRNRITQIKKEMAKGEKKK